MNYLLYNTKQRKFLKEINRGLTKKVSDAHHWSSCELEEFEIAREMSTGKTRVITIPQALTDLQEEDLGYIFNVERKDFWQGSGMGISKKIKEAKTYTLKQFKEFKGEGSIDINGVFIPIKKEAVVSVKQEAVAIVKKEVFRSSKVFDGFSTVFRQHKAKDTHCRFLHGYGISFKVTFEGELDHRNWVWDFGGMKRAKTLIDGMQPKAWMDYMFDHTLISAEDDPALLGYEAMSEAKIIQLRVIEATGAEKFAEYIYKKLNAFVKEETRGRVKIIEVEFSEHGKNAATYGE